MQLANASAPGGPSLDPVDPAPATSPPAAVVAGGVLAPATVAALGLPEAPPHPTTTPLSSVATTSEGARNERSSNLVSMLSRIGLLLSFGCGDRFYAAGGFGTVSVLETKQPSATWSKITETVLKPRDGYRRRQRIIKCACL
jgi:hypothetical protein